MANVHGLFSKKKDDEEEEDGNNNRYVGGVDSRGGGSGLAVEPNEQDAVFGMAEAAGSGEERPRRTITMYRGGFVVDDGPYRRLDDPANGEFLRALATGRTPRELIEGADGGNVTVGLVDKRQEDYVETFSSFSGAGNTLGASGAISEDGVIDPSSLLDATPVDESQPTTSIQVRLLNGQRRVIRINVDSTVAQLAAHLRESSTQPFRLISGFPPKPITNVTQSIAEAGLKGAQVTQKAA
mmetsp:Transcript_15191/g.25744  ORF Transcript_15191/g.25744 Transcript_15191/m.25744 type:complete len:240 (-) Transcript_15191:167-886(-)